MLIKEKKEYHHIYAPYKDCSYNSRILLENNTFLYIAAIKTTLSGNIVTLTPSVQAVSRSHVGNKANTGLERKLIGFSIGPRSFTSARELEHTIGLLKGEIKPSTIGKALAMIVPNSPGTRKKYLMSDILETTKEHYIMKNGRALKKAYYTETSAPEDHPLLLIRPNGNFIKATRWNPGIFKTPDEKLNMIRILEYAYEVLTTYTTVKVVEESKELTLD